MSTPINVSSYPVLAGFVRVQHDVARERWVLQAPERVLVLDESSKEIIDRCTGRTSVCAIVDALAAEYDAPREIIEHDVKTVLALLVDKSFLLLQDGPEGE